MEDWCIVPGPASRDLAEKMGKQMNARLIKVEYKIFPDGESKIILSDKVRNQPVILVQSTYPPVDRHLFQAFMLSHRLSEEGAEVNAVIPYLAYARQDKEFLKGEVVTMRVLARLFRHVGVRRLITVDIHSVEGLSNFSIPSYSASAIPLLAQHIKNKVKLTNPIAASPDFGGSSRVEAFSRILGIDHLVLEKKRDRVTGEVKVKQVNLSIEGRDVIMVDDIISTGGSVQRASVQLKKAGAKRVIAVCTHPVLVAGALEKMRKAGVDEVIGTNTIPSPVSKVDVSPAIAEHFKTLG
ncbi:MAG: ribose-phosphate pyrophosphokinase [Nitrososphaerales archaeon]